MYPDASRLRGLYLLLLYVTGGCPKPTLRNERVHQDPALSEKPHQDSANFEYDHEAFLGKEEAKTFDQLSPEESIERLGKIVERIDDDKDNYVTLEELKAWIIRVQKRYIYENVAKVWRDYDLNKDNKISWEEYKQATYGYYLANPDEFPDTADQFSFKKMLPRDERRFKAADLDGDLVATREEFTAFLHPEEFDHMKEIVVFETLEDIDKNEDGFVDEDEYIEANSFTEMPSPASLFWVNSATLRSGIFTPNSTCWKILNVAGWKSEGRKLGMIFPCKMLVPRRNLSLMTDAGDPEQQTQWWRNSADQISRTCDEDSLKVNP